LIFIAFHGDLVITFCNAGIYYYTMQSDTRDYTITILKLEHFV